MKIKKQTLCIWIIVWILILLWFSGVFAQSPIPTVEIPKPPDGSANWGIGAIAMGAHFKTPRMFLFGMKIRSGITPVSRCKSS